MGSAASRAFVTCVAGLLFGSILVPSAASACRVPPRPAVLRAYKADSIILVKVTDSQSRSLGYDWTATGTIKGRLFGSYPKAKIDFANDGIVTSCDFMGQPKPDRYYVLYLERTSEGFRYIAGAPFWFARPSGDPRLGKLNKLMPLGAAREPTSDENRLINLAEPRVREKTEIPDLSGYTRIYTRRSASEVTVFFARSRSPRRLMVDSYEEFPTPESCRCHHTEVSVDLRDLWDAGKLPPFNP